MFSLILLYAISASTFVLSKSLLVYCSPLLLTGLRTLIAGVLFLAYIVCRQRISDWRAYVIPCITIGLSSFYLSNTLKFWAMRCVTAQQATSIALIEPLVAAVFAYMLCKERITYKVLFGVSLCIAGACVGSYDGLALPECSLAAGTLICSVIASSFGALLMRAFILTHNADASVINGVSMLCAGLLALTTACFIERDVVAQTTQAPLFFWVMLACMILLSNVYAYSMYGWLVKRHSAVLISSAALLRPACVALYSGTCVMQQTMSVLIILVGLLVMYQEEMNKQHVLYKGT